MTTHPTPTLASDIERARNTFPGAFNSDGTDATPHALTSGGDGDGTVPVAWIRFCSDGSYEGPIMHNAIEQVRIKSGAWTPLFAVSHLPQVREQAALPGVSEALKLARPYVATVAERMYDGTNGYNIRQEAKRRLALIDAAIAHGTSQAAANGGMQISDERLQTLWDSACQDSAGAPGWSRHIRYGRAILAEAGLAQEKTNG